MLMQTLGRPDTRKMHAPFLRKIRHVFSPQGYVFILFLLFLSLQPLSGPPPDRHKLTRVPNRRQLRRHHLSSRSRGCRSAVGGGRVCVDEQSFSVVESRDATVSMQGTDEPLAPEWMRIKREFRETKKGSVAIRQEPTCSLHYRRKAG
jgi:hypothetical protein